MRKLPGVLPKGAKMCFIVSHNATNEVFRLLNLHQFWSFFKTKDANQYLYAYTGEKISAFSKLTKEQCQNTIWMSEILNSADTVPHAENNRSLSALFKVILQSVSRLLNGRFN